MCVSRDCVKFSTPGVCVNVLVCVCVWTIVGTARQTCCCCCCCWWDSSSSSSCSWCQGCSRFLEGIQQRCRQSCWLSCQPYGCTCVWLCVCLAVCVRLTVLACLFFCPLTIGRTCATFLSSFSFHVCPLSVSIPISVSVYPQKAFCLSLFLRMKYVCFMAAFVLTCRSAHEPKCRETYVFNLLANGKTWLNSVLPKWRSMCRVSAVFKLPLVQLPAH